MSSEKAVYCTLQYPIAKSLGIDKDYRQAFSDFDSFERAIDELTAEVVVPPDYDGETFLITHRSSAELIVGVSPIGWLLILKHRQREGCSLQFIYGMKSYEKQVVFNLPDYTEFPNTVLIDEVDAKRAIKTWLDTGSIPLFYIPNRVLWDGLAS